MRFCWRNDVCAGTQNDVLLTRQCRTACGLSDIAFSQEGAWRQTCPKTLNVCRNLSRHAKGSPFGRAGIEQSEMTERARPLKMARAQRRIFQIVLRYLSMPRAFALNSHPQ